MTPRVSKQGLFLAVWRSGGFRTLVLIAFLSGVVCLREGLGAEGSWKPVSSSVRPWGFDVPAHVPVSGEQATLETAKLSGRRWIGQDGSSHVHTRALRMTYQGRTYAAQGAGDN